jgi:hypothetical protein
VRCEVWGVGKISAIALEKRFESIDYVNSRRRQQKNAAEVI